MSHRHQNKWLGLIIYFLTFSCAIAKVDHQHHFLKQVSTSAFSENNRSAKERFIGILTEAEGQTDSTYDNRRSIPHVTQNGKILTLKYDSLGRLTHRRKRKYYLSWLPI